MTNKPGDETESDRKMVQNEVTFRQINEKVQASYAHARTDAEVNGQEYLLPKQEDDELFFHCECSDENCRQRIKLSPTDYRRIHKNRKHFVIIPGHDVPAIERIVLTTDDYLVIEKLVQPPAESHILQQTSVNNT